MSEWKNLTTEELDPAFAAIRSLFLDGSIAKMYKLVDFSPTKIARLLSMSYTTYITKLKEPWKFSNTHILLLSYAVRIDPNIIQNIIQTESETAIKAKLTTYKDKEQKRKENSIKDQE